MAYKNFPLLTNKSLNTISIEDRKSLVDVNSFAKPYIKDSGFDSFISSLPDSLAAKDLLEFSYKVKEARIAGKTIILGMGAHVIKVGLSPVIIDLMERGWISAIAVNGAFIIHDFEIAYAGKTSEIVAGNLLEGKFGNTEETGLFINSAMKEGNEKGIGAGEAIGSYMNHSDFKYNKFSILQNAYRLNIPLTVHPAIGTDFIHYHPTFDGAITGKLAERDFTLFSSVVSKISSGGIYINIGSAVILPEIFLKAISFCTAQDIEIKDFYTAVFDFNKQYRPIENVKNRPVGNGGKGFYFVGHHEIMIPLFSAILKSI